MFDSDIEARAQEILAARKATTAQAIDDAALTAATSRPVIMCKVIGNVLHGIVDTLSGASQNASQVGNYYNDAMGRLIDATGSPAAKQFGQEEQQSLQPMFDQQNKALAAKEAAMGITNSGAAKADYSDLAGNQSRTLAGAIAPLYSQALGSYGAIAGAMPGAQAGAYQGALNNFYNSLQMAASGVPGQRSTQSVGPNVNPNPYGQPVYPDVYPSGFGDYALVDPNAAPNANPYSTTAPPPQWT